MMATLSAYQYDSGLWGQLIYPNQGDMWEETSGSAMFTYAMILGVKNGWLDEKTYGTVARKGWLGLQNYLLSRSGTSAAEPGPARATHTTATGRNTPATCTGRRP